ncbi:MAG TPA: cation diffusion facilitator family transporter [Rhodocyclaceae bacterium]|nr:cation diffusion facilitator family transporter [Rhodocyclaceae bacterium]
MAIKPESSFPPDPGLLRMRQAQRVTWVSVVVNLVLTAVQIVVGVVAHSQSLLADAMHTLSDIVGDGFVLYANRKGAEAADDAHPYGHGRYETVASLVLGLLLAATGVGILVVAAERLQHLGDVRPVGIAALWAALATLAGKEILFRYMLRIAERLRSPMLVANAWHARSDALSSLVVAVGIGSTLSGFAGADTVAALIVGAMIIKAGLRFSWQAIRELIDTGLSAEEVARLRVTLVETPGVLDLHELRTRRMGHKVLADAHVQVNPRISVSEGHLIAESAKARVLRAHPDVLDVLVHVDAEDDLNPAQGFPAFPGRADMIRRLAGLLDEDPARFEQVTLHYLGQKVDAEVTFVPELARGDHDLERMERRLRERLPEDPWLRTVQLKQRAAP